MSVPKDAFRQEVALRLREARRERTLTQRQLADLGESTQQNISRYEKGFIPDSWFLLARLHAEKAIDLNWLLGSAGAATWSSDQAAQAATPRGEGPAADHTSATPLPPELTIEDLAPAQPSNLAELAKELEKQKQV